jgi:hypothetical protein
MTARPLDGFGGVFEEGGRDVTGARRHVFVTLA